MYGVTFVVGTALMIIFFYCFGFGEAMLAPRRPKVLSTELSHRLFGTRIGIGAGEAVIVTETNQIYGPRLRYNYVSKIYLEQPDIAIRNRRNNSENGHDHSSRLSLQYGRASVISHRVKSDDS